MLSLPRQTVVMAQKILDVSQKCLPRETVVMRKRSLMKSGGLTRWTCIQSQLATCPSTANLLQQMVSEAGSEKSQLTPVQENQF